MCKNDLLLVGHTISDYIINVENFPGPNQSNVINNLEILDGGSAANVAVVARNLGLKTSLISAVGHDFKNSKYGKKLKDLRIDIDDMIVSKDEKTPIAFVLTDSNQDQMTYIYWGASSAFSKSSLSQAAIKNAKVVHFGTGDPDFTLRGCEIAKSLGKIVSSDPGQDLHLYTDVQLKKMIERINILFGNHYEIDKILDRLSLSIDDLKSIGPDIIVKTCGKLGSIIYAEEKINIDPIYRDAVDPTGAGDSYRAGFFKYYLENKPLEECGNFASAVSSFIVESVGCQTNIPTTEEVLTRINEINE
ncbi:MAG: carbohydrate kinase family protein [Methanobrevibacter sp.]|jgi:sugar/nucleoside kinase (ribokinase family)|nr:carbohydrate kinase family protein [Methanobrevibacter sp.]